MAHVQVPIEELAMEWLRLDRNEDTNAEIRALLDAGNKAELEARLRTRIEFGTAGLRARMEAGFCRMNDLTVVQSSQGLCAYLLETVPDCKNRGVVIGHDQRHHSEDFARLAAGVFLAKGIKTYYYRGLVHTPMVPFGVKTLKAACGIMITASHNPKADNGYKVYWGNGCQVLLYGSFTAWRTLGPTRFRCLSANSCINRPENQAIWSWNKNLVDKNDLKSESGEPLSVDKTSEMIDRYFGEVKALCHHE
ncbi:MAG: hypothetical protein BJ554DRAFT_5609 [Olpidium bornovanus]|uniref:Alpha-D-phosphohexomutase alpha/beta/alpha domain-containing protein n=1 Tax=Olpidium bornovanus TaxID=278681 RepID=A0A8H8DKW2_9FUNG|nr:MAG: hypothetical protein BJ554DRAFT_5609 [Olpidium bornovanus]